MATDKQILGDDLEKTEATKGRPRFKRETALLLYQAGYSITQVSKYFKCSWRTAKRMKDDLIESGDLVEEEVLEKSDIVSSDFEEECRRATGLSFEQFVKDKNKGYRDIFLFCSRCWERSNLWDRPSLVLAKNRDLQIADQMAQQFLTVFGDDKKRIRTRKTRISYLFNFLGRQDINKRYLTVSESRDPRSVRRVPEIMFLDFPLKLDLCLNRLGEELGSEAKNLAQTKLCSQMRSGTSVTKEGKGILGLRKTEGESWIVMNSEDEFYSNVLEKQDQRWDIIWLPREVRKGLWEIYQKREVGEKIFDLDVRGFTEISKAWKRITKEVIGRELSFHDFRKISITFFYVMGIPLEIASSLNVGWKDANTLMKHYLHNRKLLRRSDREKYRANIPEWFKEGLNEFTEVD